MRSRASKEVEVLVRRYLTVSAKEFAKARQSRLVAASRRCNHCNLKDTSVVPSRPIGIVVRQEGKANSRLEDAATCRPKVVLGAKSGDFAQLVELEVLEPPLFPVPRHPSAQTLGYHGSRAKWRPIFAQLA